jgi:CO/xanthine dehydrogenase FAD-binding subunit
MGVIAAEQQSKSTSRRCSAADVGFKLGTRASTKWSPSLPALRSYHRPATLDEALALLSRSDVATRLIGGGTALVPTEELDPFEVVDLQATGLGGITRRNGRVVLGAMTRLQQVVDGSDVPPLVRELAFREAPNTIRNAATVGGTVATADPESELLAAFLVHEAAVMIQGRDGENGLPLAGVLGNVSVLGGAIITAVTLEPDGAAVSHRTGRTPADRPIVCVAGRRRQGAALLAATGVAATPVLIDPDHLADLEPPGDFRGSPEYRRRLAEVLAARVVADLEEAAP